jgi:hypothetical protein
MNFLIQIILVTGFFVWWWLGWELGYYSKGKRKNPAQKKDDKPASVPSP